MRGLWKIKYTERFDITDSTFAHITAKTIKVRYCWSTS